MPYCVNCGGKIELEWANCPNCGNSIQKFIENQERKPIPVDNKVEKTISELPSASPIKRTIAGLIDPTFDSKRHILA